jgi:hypothetical protein
MHPSASFSATLRVHLVNQPGSFASLAEAIGQAGGLLGAIDLVRVERGKKVRDVTVLAADGAHLERIVRAVRAVPGIDVEHVSDRTFLMHLGGKLESGLHHSERVRPTRHAVRRGGCRRRSGDERRRPPCQQGP